MDFFSLGTLLVVDKKSTTLVTDRLKSLTEFIFCKVTYQSSQSNARVIDHIHHSAAYQQPLQIIGKYEFFDQRLLISFHHFPSIDFSKFYWLKNLLRSPIELFIIYC